MAGESPAQAGWMVTGLTAGSVVAGYRVESRVGAGGMAMVFRARDESLGRTVALKVLAPALADDAAFRERFIRESRAAAVVDHPHIIPVYGAGEFEGVLYLAMRYVAGGDLRALLQREGPLPPSRAAFLLSPLASALDAGHAAGLVHRDVKPANVLIDTSPGRPDHLYLSDFGLAKGNATTGLTGTGQFLGTLDYCAPEQIGGKPARPQTDQYALGCVAYTMFTGAVPFPRDEVTAVLWAHMSEPPPLVTALRPDLPAAVDAVIARAMAKDPEERYPSCAEFAEAVRAALGVDAYTTPSSVYTAAGTGLPSVRVGELGDLASVVTPEPVPPSPLSVPPTPLSMPPAVPPYEAAAPVSAAAAHPPTQSHSSIGFATTTARTVPAPGSSAAGEASHPQAVNQARRRRTRLGMLTAAAVVVAVGGVTVAALALSSLGRGAPTASLPPAPTTSRAPTPIASPSPPPLATLADPSGYGPSALGFKPDDTVITADNHGHAYTWKIEGGGPTPTNYLAAVRLASAESTVITPAAWLRLVRVHANVIQVQQTGRAIESLSVPQGTEAILYTFNENGTEVAVADSNGKTYVWTISSS